MGESWTTPVGVAVAVGLVDWSVPGPTGAVATTVNV